MQIQYDYNNFNPEGPSYPADGPHVFKFLGAERGETKDHASKIVCNFQVARGPETGKTFQMNFNTGHSNMQTRQIAFEGLGRIYYGCTGQKPPVSGFDLGTIAGREFAADFFVKESEGYRNPNFRNIKPLDANGQPQASAQPAQAGGVPW